MLQRKQTYTLTHFWVVALACTGRTVGNLDRGRCSPSLQRAWGIKWPKEKVGIFFKIMKLEFYFILYQFECYSRFVHPRTHQTLVQMLASFVVVIIINGTLAQYSEG